MDAYTKMCYARRCYHYKHHLMPNTPSAKKTLRQDKKKVIKNTAVKRDMKKAIKEVRKAIAEKATDTQEKLRTAQKKIGKAAQNSVIKKNAASRYLSRLARAVNKKVDGPKA